MLGIIIIQQDPTNPSIPSANNPTGRGLLARLTWSCLRQIFEITENDQNIYKPWIGTPDDDYLYTGIFTHPWNLALLRFMSISMKNVPTNPPSPLLLNRLK